MNGPKVNFFANHLKLMLFLIFVILVSLVLLAGGFLKQNNIDTSKLSPNYLSSLADFREKNEARLKNEAGWLTVVGLHWLSEHNQTLGSSIDNDIQLPSPVPEKLGSIKLANSQVEIIFNSSTFEKEDQSLGLILIDDKTIRTNQKYILKTDKSDTATSVKLGSVSFSAIERKNGIGLRVRDQNSEARQAFKSKLWYKPNSNYIVEADWYTHAEPRILKVPDIIGNVNEELSPGYVEFEIDGQKYELHPTQSEEQLFFVFKDATSGETTYGAVRFLYTDLPKDGKVVLDFNKAINPPCAFTKYATCPLPPKENILKAAIAAGELKPKSSI